MTAKELITILKRFPKNAIVKVSGSPDILIQGQMNELGEWTVQLTRIALNDAEEKDTNQNLPK